MSRRWRAWHDEWPAERGARVRLGAEESHHISRVLRLRAGDPIALFDGRGREWAGRLESCRPDGVDVVLEHAIDDPVESPLELVLFQALCRSDRMEWVLQKATEIGVRGLRAVPTRRAEARPPGSGRLDRWRRIVLEACKQSGRRCAPELDTPAELPAPPRDGTLALLLDAADDAVPLERRLERERPPRVWLAVGPESGFDDDEAADWRAAGWLPTSLGPRILRTETAGLVAAALVLHRWSDLGSVGGDTNPA